MHKPKLHIYIYMVYIKKPKMQADLRLLEAAAPVLLNVPRREPFRGFTLNYVIYYHTTYVCIYIYIHMYIYIYIYIERERDV